MLAAHRDQENLVHSHQVPAKQQPKTPGARYPKTPMGFARNNENALTGFGGKSAVIANDKMGKATSQRQAMVTPMDNRSRAPLGNKTTNAKARTGQTIKVKDRVKEIERSQTKQPTAQKPKQRSAENQLSKLHIQPDAIDGSEEGDDAEPEYAPPRPTPLPYESDVLPKGGLTFNGLKKENVLKGYYHHYHNPVDGNGVSLMEKKFAEEMETVLRKAEDRNSRELDTITWNPEDVAEHALPNLVRPDTKQVPARLAGRAAGGSSVQKQAPTLASRRAASVLAVHCDRQGRTIARPTPGAPAAKRPLSALISGGKPAKPVVTSPTSSSGNSTGEAASRTTLGYNKGKSASSMVHSRTGSQSTRHQQAAKPPTVRDLDFDLTVTPARLRQTAAPALSQPKPEFTSIFDDDDDDDLPPLRQPFQESEDEDEFELKLTI